MTKRVVLCLKIGLAALLIWLLVQAGLLDLGKLAGIQERWPWLLVAQVPLIGLLLAASLRWHLLMRARGVAIHFRDTCAIVLIGWFFNQTLPSSTGGDVAKAWSVAADHPDCRGDAVMSILMDRVVGLVALLVFALVGAGVNLELLRGEPRLAHLAGGVALVLAGVVGSLALFYSARLRRALPIERLEAWVVARLRLDSASLPGRLYRRLRALALEADRAVYAYRSHTGALAAGLGLSFVLHSMTVCVNLSLAVALLGTGIEVRPFFLLIPLAHIGMTLGITPGNLGVGEAIYAELFRWAGAAQGGLICVLQRVCWIAWALVGGAIFLLRGGRSRAAHSNPLPESSNSPG